MTGWMVCVGGVTRGRAVSPWDLAAAGGAGSAPPPGLLGRLCTGAPGGRSTAAPYRRIAGRAQERKPPGSNLRPAHYSSPNISSLRSLSNKWDSNGGVCVCSPHRSCTLCIIYVSKIQYFNKHCIVIRTIHKDTTCKQPPKIFKIHNYKNNSLSTS